jgi:uncharacterized cupin superfamily protein
VRKTLVLGAVIGAAAVLAVLASAAVSSDIYIRATEVERVPGKNAAAVRLAWDYKCLGDDGGSYEWTLKVVRTQPLPEKTTTLGSGTSERGDKTVQLRPGRYLPKSEPYLCENNRGQGYDKPEIGAPFTVPDYCSWIVSSARGVVQLEHETTVKLAKPGSVVAPGDAIATPRNGRAVLASAARNGQATLGGGSRLALDAKQCARTGGWRLELAKGAVTASVPAQADVKTRFQTATSNATVTAGRRATWRMKLAGRTTKVRVLVGNVIVTKKSGRPVSLRAGQATSVTA